MTGRYPFTAGSPNGIPLDDFARLFAPNGMINKFFNAQLRPFVDTSGSIWKAQAVAGVAPPVTPGDLAQFQRAAPIGELFFAGGGAQPTVRFDITPNAGHRRQAGDAGSRRPAIVYAHGPQRATSVTWPGPNRHEQRAAGVRSAAVQRTARAVGERAVGIVPPVRPGHAAAAGSSERYTLTFHVGDRQASFEIRAGSVLNPFAPGMLHDFKCSGTLTPGSVSDAFARGCDGRLLRQSCRHAAISSAPVCRATSPIPGTTGCNR